MNTRERMASSFSTLQRMIEKGETEDALDLLNGIKHSRDSQDKLSGLALNKTLTGRTLLDLAIEYNREEVATELLTLFKDEREIIFNQTQEGFTPLMLAARKNNLSLVKKLFDAIKEAGDANHSWLVIDNDGNTHFHHAALAPNAEPAIFTLLAENIGSNANDRMTMKNNQSQTPLDLVSSITPFNDSLFVYLLNHYDLSLKDHMVNKKFLHEILPKWMTNDVKFREEKAQKNKQDITPGLLQRLYDAPNNRSLEKGEKPTNKILILQALKKYLNDHPADNTEEVRKDIIRQAAAISLVHTIYANLEFNPDMIVNDFILREKKDTPANQTPVDADNHNVFEKALPDEQTDVKRLFFLKQLTKNDEQRGIKRKEVTYNNLSDALSLKAHTPTFFKRLEFLDNNKKDDDHVFYYNQEVDDLILEAHNKKIEAEIQRLNTLINNINHAINELAITAPIKKSHIAVGILATTATFLLAASAIAGSSLLVEKYSPYNWAPTRCNDNSQSENCELPWNECNPFQAGCSNWKDHCGMICRDSNSDARGLSWLLFTFVILLGVGATGAAAGYNYHRIASDKQEFSADAGDYQSLIDQLETIISIRFNAPDSYKEEFSSLNKDLNRFKNAKKRSDAGDTLKNIQDTLTAISNKLSRSKNLLGLPPSLLPINQLASLDAVVIDDDKPNEQRSPLLRGYR